MPASCMPRFKVQVQLNRLRRLNQLPKRGPTRPSSRWFKRKVIKHKIPAQQLDAEYWCLHLGHIWFVSSAGVLYCGQVLWSA